MLVFRFNFPSVGNVYDIRGKKWYKSLSNTCVPCTGNYFYVNMIQRTGVNVFHLILRNLVAIVTFVVTFVLANGQKLAHISESINYTNNA